MKFSIIADIPDALGHAFLQHVRDFDAGHAGCHFQIMVDAPELQEREVIELLDIDPPFPIFRTVRKQ